MSTETTTFEAEADELIRTPWPGYQEPLQRVRDWVRSDGEALRAAIRVLEHLHSSYPHAIKVAQELVLAYLQTRQTDGRKQAEQLLAQLEEEFPYKDEETLCRLGRLHRDVGDNYLLGEPTAEADRRLAAGKYEKAWEEYDRAFAVRAWFYPGINRAALFLLRAWTAAEPDSRRRLLDESRQAAMALLSSCRRWLPEYPDDNIWHLASEAEAELLLSRWDEAIHLYRRAAEQANYSDFYRDSIGDEVRRLLRPLRELLQLPEEKAQELQNLFALRSTPKPTG